MEPGARLNGALVAAAYVTGGLLIVMPLTEVALSILPFRPSAASWRFGTAGVISQALLTPILGLVLLVGSAALLGHRRTLIGISIVGWVVSILTLVAIALFALDAIEMRSQVRPEVKRAFDLSTMLAVIKLSIAVALGALIAIGARRAARSIPRRRR